MLDFESRSYTRTMFHGYIYRFLAELFRDDDVTLAKKYPDVGHYEIAHLTEYEATAQSEAHTVSRYSYSQLQELVESPLPTEQQGHVLFLCGHMSGSWVSAVGAKYGIVPEFFRRHMHLWRSLEGSVLHAIPRSPSAACRGLSP